ncbi:cilia- and flagella-associated protein 119 isoform X1 [Anolis carolinensis]|uniref:cilia- and flagella-associated protein 119 isoform X1 n=2 Tax=Anolis carolinensis TaxID=28377 RepID=UPI000203AEF6|nr:PREDICTED: coiled-coil domain-containing protein 189 isoform X1 [Anolis carolinensis]XP_008119171.1 PREDICTED: coiled-coil domain-containing protein 189 isoform X1 [Anolis carolinensis]XP_008119172.1 PREDICTED: coiled-coil domain-containing protein 189 isoform X1 [Anolis carolinensis]|eukprot:XP_003227734.1 PREDICTED: coiled-coil domain-containing protein 189 isoform X1 [Anolis carolinensis]
MATVASFSPPPERPLMGPESLNKPRSHKAKICMWKYLDVHSMDLINAAKTTDSLKSLLAELLHLQDFESNPRSAILLDLYFYTIQFSREQGFNREQTSTFFSIVKDVHEACVETPLPNVEECYSYFKELVFCHSIRRPPFSIDLFNQDHLVLITDYMINTYFRHFKLYKYVFTPQVRLDISFTYLGMPEPEPKEEEAAAESLGLSPVPEEAEETPVQEESPTAALREYIATQLNQELAQLRISVEERLKTTEEQFAAKLIQLEKGPSARKASTKGKKK